MRTGNGTEFGREYRFLAIYVLASALAFVLLAPFTGLYFQALSMESNAVFGLIGHPVRLEVEAQAALYMRYRFPPPAPGGSFRILVLAPGSVNLGLIVLPALCLATPGFSIRRRLTAIIGGIVFISVLHVSYMYGLSHLLLWDNAGSVPDNLKPFFDDHFPAWVHRLLEPRFGYLTFCVREMAPLLVWFWFARHSQLFRPCPEAAAGAGPGA